MRDLQPKAYEDTEPGEILGAIPGLSADYLVSTAASFQANIAKIGSVALVFEEHVLASIDERKPEAARAYRTAIAVVRYKAHADVYDLDGGTGKLDMNQLVRATAHSVGSINHRTDRRVRSGLSSISELAYLAEMERLEVVRPIARAIEGHRTSVGLLDEYVAVVTGSEDGSHLPVASLLGADAQSGKTSRLRAAIAQRRFDDRERVVKEYVETSRSGPAVPGQEWLQFMIEECGISPQVIARAIEKNLKEGHLPSDVRIGVGQIARDNQRNEQVDLLRSLAEVEVPHTFRTPSYADLRPPTKTGGRLPIASQRAEAEVVRLSAEAVSKEETHKFGGLLQRTPDNGYIVSVPSGEAHKGIPREVQEVIDDVSKHDRSRRKKLVTIFEQLLAEPFGHGTKFLRNRVITVNGNSMTIRAYDPAKRPGSGFGRPKGAADPSGMRFTYVVIDGQVYLEGLRSHDDYQTRFMNRRST